MEIRPDNPPTEDRARIRPQKTGGGVRDLGTQVAAGVIVVMLASGTVIGVVTAVLAQLANPWAASVFGGACGLIGTAMIYRLANRRYAQRYDEQVKRQDERMEQLEARCDGLLAETKKAYELMAGYELRANKREKEQGPETPTV